MSLDVYLEMPYATKRAEKIYVRDQGATREVSREEWDELNPGIEPVAVAANETHEVFSRNITHNLTEMAAKAGLYEPLWRPEEIGITRAAQLIPILRDGFKTLTTERARLTAFNPTNGWGSHSGLVEFVAAYLQACEEHPDAIVRVSR